MVSTTWGQLSGPGDNPPDLEEYVSGRFAEVNGRCYVPHFGESALNIRSIGETLLKAFAMKRHVFESKNRDSAETCRLHM